MIYRIQISKKAQKQLAKLNKSFQNTFNDEIKLIAQDPYRGKPLKHKLKKYCSWRTDDYRIIYQIIEKQQSINIIAVGHRKNIYEIIRRLLAILFSI